MSITIRTIDKQSVKKNTEYNVSVLQLLQQLRLHTTDATALYNIRSYPELIDAVVELLVPEGGREIEPVIVAAELYIYPLWNFCFKNLSSLPFTYVFLQNWRRLLIDLASEQQVEPSELISRILHSIRCDFPGLSEGMIGLVHRFLSMSVLPFISLYHSVLQYKVPAKQIITEAPLSLSIATIPPLSAFQLYDTALADHNQQVLQQVSKVQDDRSPCLQPSLATSPLELNYMSKEDERCLHLRTKRAPSEAMVRAQNELTAMGIEDSISTILSASINQEHRIRKEEHDCTLLVSQKLQAPTDTLLESLREHQQNISRKEVIPSVKVNK